MRKSTIIWLIIATSLILIGTIIFGGAMTMLKWDFTKLSTVKYETNEYNVSEQFKNISIEADTANITVIPSETSESIVICHEQTKVKHTVTVEDETLSIKVEDTRKWYDHINIYSGSPIITVYAPQGEYGDLSIKASTGDILIEKDLKFNSVDIRTSTGDVTHRAHSDNNVKIKTSTGYIFVESIDCAALDLTVTTGKIDASNINCQGDVSINVSTGKSHLTNISCKNIISNGNTGDILLKNVIASENVTIKRSTGDVKLEECDAAELNIKTDTGDVTGSLLSEKVFITKSDTGRINVPKTTTGGVCEISTDTGNIVITIS